jgi:crotonobetainyl-CoA:carnitine CoA-transferase CaiB-like acyl-CoA transferase
MLSASQQGQTGPHAAFAGTGNLLAALCGFYQITGYKGGEPRPLHGAYWEAFCDVLGRPAWTQRPAFAMPLQRLRHVADLDQHVAAWTCTQEAHALMHRLQGTGVPAGVVARASDLHADPQLQERGFFFDLAHPELGVTRYDGPQFHLSATPAVFNRPAPLLGQHNTYVLQELLGLSAADVARLVAAEMVK